MSSLSVSVKLELDDYASYNSAYLGRYRWRLVLYVVLLLIVMGNAIRQSWDVVNDKPVFLLLLAVPLAIFSLAFYLRSFFSRNRLKKIYESDASLRQEHVYTFSDEGISLKSPTSD